MDMNVTRLEFELSVSHDNRIVMTLTIQKDDEKYPESPMLHSETNIRQFIAQAIGETPWHDTVMWGDVSRAVAVAKDGIQLWHYNERAISYYTFPAHLLGRKIDYHLHMFQCSHMEYKRFAYSPERLREWKKETAPNVKLVFANNDTLLRYTQNVKTDYGASLKRCIQGEVRGAKNQSNGNPIEVQLSPDFVDGSFYVQVMDTQRNKGLWNGGIILSQGEYSSHH